MQEGSQSSLPEAIRYGGSAFLMGWFLLFFSGEIWGIDFEYATESVAYVSLISIACCFVTLVVLNLIGRKGIVKPQVGGLHFIALGVILTLGTVGIAFGHVLPTPVFVISCVAVGASGAFFICAAILQLARLEPRAVLITCGVIFLVGIFIYSFAFYVPRALTTPILCLLPFLSCFFFAFDKAGPIHSLPEALDEAPQKESLVSWRAIILLSIFMLFSCVVRGYLPFSIDNASFSYTRSFSIVLMLIMAASVVIVPALLPERIPLSALYKGVFIIGVLLFALFPIFGMEDPIVLVLADGYRGLCALMTLAFFAFMARDLHFFGYRSVGGGLVVYIACGFLGWLLGLLLHDAGLDADAIRIYSSIQCVVVLLAFIVLFRQNEVDRFSNRIEGEFGAGVGSSDVHAGKAPSPDGVQADGAQVGGRTAGGEAARGNALEGGEALRGNAAEGGEAGGRWRQNLAGIAAEKGLTAREEEVFILLAKGFKARNISERLSVSYNTTRAHIRNIYQKCDVHSQEEFVDLIDAPHDE